MNKSPRQLISVPNNEFSDVRCIIHELHYAPKLKLLANCDTVLTDVPDGLCPEMTGRAVYHEETGSHNEVTKVK